MKREIIKIEKATGLIAKYRDTETKEIIEDKIFYLIFHRLEDEEDMITITPVCEFEFDQGYVDLGNVSNFIGISEEQKQP